MKSGNEVRVLTEFIPNDTDLSTGFRVRINKESVAGGWVRLQRLNLLVLNRVILFRRGDGRWRLEGLWLG